MGALFIKLYQNTMEFIARLLLFNRNMPKGYFRLNNISYSKYGKLDLFTPDNKNGKLLVLIYIHGGGWTTGSKRTSAHQCAVFASEGFLVLNIKYRLGPKYKHPAALEDIGQVLVWLNKNHIKYNADLDTIFFGGSSAGAHLSCMAVCIATNDDLRRKIGVEFPLKASSVAGSLLIYGGYNMETIVNTKFFMVKTMIKSYIGTYKVSEYKLKDQISPIHHITDAFPPAFITAGERDHLYSQTTELIEVLDAKSIKYEKLLFDYSIKNARHAFVNFYNRDCSKAAYKGMIEFLKKQSMRAEIK